jgi:hypothetical protein
MNKVTAVNVATKAELTFLDVTPKHAAQYGVAEQRGKLSQFFLMSPQERDVAYPCTTDPDGAVWCQDWVATEERMGD